MYPAVELHLLCKLGANLVPSGPILSQILSSDTVLCNIILKSEDEVMIISGAAAQTGPWPPFTGFRIVYSTMWSYQLHDRPVLDTLIQPSETSSSDYQRLVAK
jgi:hypothetical protein